MTEDVVRLPDDEALAARVAEDVVGLLSDAQAAGREPSLVLTGGTVSRAVHAAMAGLGAALDWSRLDVWWGDERFVPAADEERNAGQARADLLGRVPVDPQRVHEMAASDQGCQDVEEAAAAYDAVLRPAVDGHDAPWFDVLMLGIGPDGHCASLFPGRPEVDLPDLVLPVSGSPKPPPERVTLGMSALRRAAHVVFVATGAEKAGAVAASVRGADVHVAPCAGPRGSVSTTWYVDGAAAASL